MGKIALKSTMVLLAALMLVGLSACKAGYGASNDAALSRLSISEGNLTPSFSKTEYEYTLDLSFSESQIKFNARASSGEATMELQKLPSQTSESPEKTFALTDDTESDVIDIPTGVSYWDILVTAGDSSEQRYKFTIERDATTSSNADLSSLVAENVDFEFSSAIQTYDIDLNYFVNATRLLATPSDDSADFSGFSGDGQIEPGEYTSYQSLTAGQDRALSFTVEATNGTSTKNYSLTLGRKAVTELGYQSYIKGKEVAAEDQFGAAVAIDGDTLVVGAPKEEQNSNTDTGAVFIYNRNGVLWNADPAPLRLSSPVNSDEFGYAVAIDGDRLVVGAPGANGGMGRAYIYERSSNTWGSNPVRTMDGNVANGRFGESVAISGTYIAVGAPQSTSNKGAVFVYDAGSTTYTVSASTLDAETALKFGSALEFTSNRQLLIGSAGAQGTAGGADAGVVFVYQLNESTWSQVGNPLQSSASGDLFGKAISSKGDMVLVGAPGKTSGEGAAYVFTRTSSDTVWSATSQQLPLDPETAISFGSSVTIINSRMVAVGAPEELGTTGGISADEGSLGTQPSGAVFVFEYSGSDWGLGAYIKSTDVDQSSDEDDFGSAIAADGTTLAIGAPLEDGSAVGVNSTDSANDSLSNAGAVFVVQ